MSDKTYRIMILVEEVDVESGEAEEMADYTALLAHNLPDIPTTEDNLVRIRQLLEFYEA